MSRLKDRDNMIWVNRDGRLFNADFDVFNQLSTVGNQNNRKKKEMETYQGLMMGWDTSEPSPQDPMRRADLRKSVLRVW